MSWSIHHVNLQAHNVRRTTAFLRDMIGLTEGEWVYPPAEELGQIGHDEDHVGYFGSGNRGVHVVLPIATFPRDNGFLHNPTLGGHVAITVPDVHVVASNLDKAGIPWSDAGTYAMRGVHQIYCYDPSWNVVEFNQVLEAEDWPEGIHPWERDWGWGIHHVNLQAIGVRESVGFFTEMAGMTEGRWDAPKQMGDFSTDPARLAILALGEGNRGIHLIEPDAGFAQRNGFAHNPSLGGHPAFWVKDVEAVMARLAAAGWPYSDAGVYAMPGMHQIYCLDPSANMLEINQYV